jgi:hypothetical protein
LEERVEGHIGKQNLRGELANREVTNFGMKGNETRKIAENSKAKNNQNKRQTEGRDGCCRTGSNMKENTVQPLGKIN